MCVCIRVWYVCGVVNVACVCTYGECVCGVCMGGVCMCCVCVWCVYIVCICVWCGECGGVCVCMCVWCNECGVVSVACVCMCGECVCVCVCVTVFSWTQPAEPYLRLFSCWVVGSQGQQAAASH